MANKKSAEATTSAQTEQATTPKEYIEVGQLRMKHRIHRAIFAGVCAAQGWKPGKFVTEDEFLGAVKQFTEAPMSGVSHKKEARK